MTTETQKPIALFPDLPRQSPIVGPDGKLSEVWQLALDQLVIALQTNLKPEGFVTPQQTATNISLLTGTQSVANIIYDSTNHAFKGNINGTWKTFTLT